MGAELIVAIVKEPDWTTIQERIVAIPTDALIEYGEDYLGYDDEEGVELATTVNDYLANEIGSLHDGTKLKEMRHCYIHTIEGTNYIVTGGSSWGDDPSDEWGAVNAIEHFGLNT